MSRIGKKPIPIPAGVTVKVENGMVSVKGKSELSLALPPHVACAVEDSMVVVTVSDEKAPKAGAMHGLARSLINNMIIGVTAGFRKDLTIIGTGYRAQVAGQKLTLNLGYSHPVIYDVPAGVTVKVADNTKISVEGADKQLVGETAARIRRFRKPEPYKGKGVRYADEHVIIKEGKSAG